MKKYKYEIPFINRVEEKKYFSEYLNNQPSNILFVYWPKSTGKTTLLKKVIENLDNTQYAISFLNLREKLIIDFKSFRNTFFPKDLKNKVKDIVSWVKVDFWFFAWGIEDENMLNDDVFWLMVKKLREANEKWIKPVIILDEFQYLKDIYLDDKKEVKLINELFKLFIGITKQDNLAHVICMTSDSYFLDELYFDTKLKNTSKFFMVNHLEKKDIEYWLIKKEGLDQKIVNDIWENLWGSVWEIWQVFIEYKNNLDYKTRMNDLIQVEYSKIGDYFLQNYMFWKIDIDEKFTFLRLIENISKLWFHKIWQKDIWILRLIKDLVDKDILFYDVKTLKITANSKSVAKWMEKFLDELENS